MSLVSILVSVKHEIDGSIALIHGEQERAHAEELLGERIERPVHGKDAARLAVVHVAKPVASRFFRYDPAGTLAELLRIVPVVRLAILVVVDRGILVTHALVNVRSIKGALRVCVEHRGFPFRLRPTVRVVIRGSSKWTILDKPCLMEPVQIVMLPIRVPFFDLAERTEERPPAFDELLDEEVVRVADVARHAQAGEILLVLLFESLVRLVLPEIVVMENVEFSFCFVELDVDIIQLITDAAVLVCQIHVLAVSLRDRLSVGEAPGAAFRHELRHLLRDVVLLFLERGNLIAESFLCVICGIQCIERLVARSLRGLLLFLTGPGVVLVLLVLREDGIRIIDKIINRRADFIQRDLLVREGIRLEPFCNLLENLRLLGVILFVMRSALDKELGFRAPSLGVEPVDSIHDVFRNEPAAVRKLDVSLVLLQRIRYNFALIKKMVVLHPLLVLEGIHPAIKRTEVCVVLHVVADLFFRADLVVRVARLAIVADNAILNSVELRAGHDGARLLERIQERLHMLVFAIEIQADGVCENDGHRALLRAVGDNVVLELAIVSDTHVSRIADFAARAILHEAERSALAGELAIVDKERGAFFDFMLAPRVHEDGLIRDFREELCRAVERVVERTNLLVDALFLFPARRRPLVDHRHMGDGLHDDVGRSRMLLACVEDACYALLGSLVTFDAEISERVARRAVEGLPFELRTSGFRAFAEDEALRHEAAADARHVELVRRLLEASRTTRQIAEVCTRTFRRPTAEAEHRFDLTVVVAHGVRRHHREAAIFCMLPCAGDVPQDVSFVLIHLVGFAKSVDLYLVRRGGTVDVAELLDALPDGSAVFCAVRTERVDFLVGSIRIKDGAIAFHMPRAEAELRHLVEFVAVLFPVEALPAGLLLANLVVFLEHAKQAALYGFVEADDAGHHRVLDLLVVRANVHVDRGEGVLRDVVAHALEVILDELVVLVEDVAERLAFLIEVAEHGELLRRREVDGFDVREDAVHELYAALR